MATSLHRGNALHGHPSRADAVRGAKSFVPTPTIPGPQHTTNWPASATLHRPPGLNTEPKPRHDLSSAQSRLNLRHMRQSPESLRDVHLPGQIPSSEADQSRRQRRARLGGAYASSGTDQSSAAHTLPIPNPHAVSHPAEGSDARSEWRSGDLSRSGGWQGRQGDSPRSQAVHDDQACEASSHHGNDEKGAHVECVLSGNLFQEMDEQGEVEYWQCSRYELVETSTKHGRELEFVSKPHEPLPISTVHSKCQEDGLKDPGIAGRRRSVKAMKDHTGNPAKAPRPLPEPPRRPLPETPRRNLPSLPPSASSTMTAVLVHSGLSTSHPQTPQPEPRSQPRPPLNGESEFSTHPQDASRTTPGRPPTSGPPKHPARSGDSVYASEKNYTIDEVDPYQKGSKNACCVIC
ncbi:hypothetical protein C8T65DRAFT_675296 [Cerioporus squamosus]|nr:hypothetical protein C8T65DRAFT_675296 [Cerioporus squamosus]